MKKTFFFLAALATVSLTSCSSDDSDSSNQNPDPSTSVLPKRVVWEQQDPDGFNYDITYTYNGNKLLQGNYTNGDKEKFYYTGDLITKIEYLYDGQVDAQELFEYDSNNRLVTYKYQDLEDGYQERSVFVYNTGDTVTESYYSETMTSPSSTATVIILTFADGEMTKIVQQGFSTYNYTYDSKNSPFKNVTGYAAIAYAAHGDFETEGKNQNILSIVDQTNNSAYMTNTIQYNANNYPTTITSVAILDSNYPNTTDELVLKYFYE